jgi:hypothetical protein
VRPLKDDPDLVVGGHGGGRDRLFGEEQESNSTTAIDSAANRICMAAIFTGILTVVGAVGRSAASSVIMLNLQRESRDYRLGGWLVKTIGSNW